MEKVNGQFEQKKNGFPFMINEEMLTWLQWSVHYSIEHIMNAHIQLSFFPFVFVNAVAFISNDIPRMQDITIGIMWKVLFESRLNYCTSYRVPIGQMKRVLLFQYARTHLAMFANERQ